MCFESCFGSLRLEFGHGNLEYLGHSKSTFCLGREREERTYPVPALASVTGSGLLCYWFSFLFLLICFAGFWFCGPAGQENSSVFLCILEAPFVSTELIIMSSVMNPDSALHYCSRYQHNCAPFLLL